MTECRRDGEGEPAVHVFGHRAIWVYADTRDEVGDGTSRPCPKCGKFPNEDGSDPCLMRIPGVIAACCGHGVSIPWAITEDRRTVEGWANIVKLIPPEMREAHLDTAVPDTPFTQAMRRRE